MESQQTIFHVDPDYSVLTLENCGVILLCVATHRVSICRLYMKSNNGNPYDSNLFSCGGLSLVRWRFSVRSYCWPGERQVTLRLRSECLLLAFHKFSRTSKIRYSVCASDCTLILSPLCQQLLTCTKNGQPYRRRSIELHKRESN